MGAVWGVQEGLLRERLLWRLALSEAFAGLSG